MTTSKHFPLHIVWRDGGWAILKDGVQTYWTVSAQIALERAATYAALYR